jgi:hypothetical protein
MLTINGPQTAWKGAILSDLKNAAHIFLGWVPPILSAKLVANGAVEALDVRARKRCQFRR